MTVNLCGAEWFKSSYSQAHGECVEVAWLADGAVGIRDSKNPTGPALVFAAGDWAAFTISVRNDRFAQ
ncbi:DUF397 domain-containing protein [Nocardia sp. MDA0666]|uniref:DUF397 domain-containing protein n=1 Tax=Nocardia sp. MDA0666 TaxID=2135448 RepID=UPI000D13E52A|nr:DUF397 domain-containing protein [Nocardia sp. MDA0666]PSR66841.1 DUF397 domain-containing protein [Nocardia sp. MDA0666]